MTLFDVVFSGNGIIAENGELLAESTRFCMDEQLIYTEIDIERLQNDRRQNSSYMSCRTGKDNNYRTVKFELPTTQVNLLSRKIGAYPFACCIACPHSCAATPTAATLSLA